jgi:hypothetical protein
LIAASSLLFVESSTSSAGAVLMDALEDLALRMREAAHQLVESLGASGAGRVLRLMNGQESSDYSTRA